MPTPELSGFLGPGVSVDAPQELPEQETYDVTPEGEVSVSNNVIATISGFNQNLADLLDPSDRKRIAGELLQLIDADEASRAKWMERVRRGMEMIGVIDVPSATKMSFDGCSRLVHPAMLEAATQYSSRAIAELCPPTGPCKMTVIGARTPEIDEQAERTQEYVNWRLMTDDAEYFDDTDNMLPKQALFGSVFRKCFQDPVTGKATLRQVSPDRFIAPYDARSMKSASRYAHEMRYYVNDIKRAIAYGSWLDIGNFDEPSQNLVKDTEADADSKDDMQENSERILYEMHCDWTLEVDHHSEAFDLPYIFIIDKDNQDLYSIRRNWKEADPLKQKRIWFSHYKYLQGLGFYGWGLLHAVGSLSEAASGALRALLDSAARANNPGGFKSKDLKIAGDITVAPGQWKDVDATMDELNKGFFKLPYNEPSEKLIELLRMMVESIQRFASTVDTMVGDAPNTGPVGTTVALIEQGSKVYSAVHKRTHASMKVELGMFVELEHETLKTASYPYLVNEGQGLLMQDLDDRIDVVPVSDPNIYSSVQRLALAQAGLQLATSQPELYGPAGLRLFHLEMLRALRFPQPERVLLPPQPLPEVVQLQDQLQQAQAMIQQLEQQCQQHETRAAQTQDKMAKTQAELGAAHGERDAMAEQAQQHAADAETAKQAAAQAGQEAGAARAEADHHAQARADAGSAMMKELGLQA